MGSVSHCDFLSLTKKTGGKLSRRIPNLFGKHMAAGEFG